MGVRIDANHSWQYHVNDLSIKPNRAATLFFKIRKYVNLKTLRSICFAIFDSYRTYCSELAPTSLSWLLLLWTQNCSTIQWILILQRMLLELLVPYSKKSLILKFQDKDLLRNYFICHQIFK